MSKIRYVVRDRVNQGDKSYKDMLKEAKVRAKDEDVTLVRIINDLDNTDWILDVEKDVGDA